ncbi:MAG: DUF2700 domain-containing protein [Tissierellia bacterium]|nr:DUF2700 domain-containing protein [Tissierellia bacterium]
MTVIEMIILAITWVLTIIILKKNSKINKDKTNNTYMSEGISIGMFIGLSFGLSLGEEYFPLGMSLGLLIGMIVGVNIDKKKNL